jgi:tetratricopeptide (TPR) repeat protein/DNA-binding SARP family transcriptional activator
VLASWLRNSYKAKLVDFRFSYVKLSWTARILSVGEVHLPVAGGITGTRMEFNILGPLEILPLGQAPDLQRAKERCLLAIFLMTPNRVHRTESLIFQVWDDDDPPDTVPRTLRSYIAHIRDIAEASGGEAQLLTESGGYLLRVDQDHIDLHRFRALKDQADGIALSGDITQAVGLLQEAERLWRGPPLSGLPGRWMAGMRESLEAEHRAVLMKRLGLELELGRHAELAGELQRLSARFPLDETCVAYEMTALYRSGRQADALKLYHEARDRLSEQGIEPGAGLSALHQRILSQDPSLMITLARRHSSSLPQPSALPEITDQFVGRSEELQKLTDEAGARSSQIKIIAGMGGVGKTTLAFKAASLLADMYPDGILYLNFHSHVPGEVPIGAAEALRRLLEMLGTPPTPKPRGLRELTALWQGELASRRLVIILDDVPGSVAVVPVLPNGKKCLTLVTTRNRLADVSNASELTLDMLPESDAIVLFTKIAGPEKANDSVMVAKAVRLCECLPLAIKLTATRLHADGSSTVSDFIARVEGLQAFPDGLGGASQQLMSTFELSYRDLPSEHQRFFRRLGMNPCTDFTAHSAAIMADAAESEAEAAISILLDRHLIERGAMRRFRFHDLVRSYASFCAERDDSRQERRGAERRLLDYLLRYADSADRLLYPHRRRPLTHAPGRPALQSEIDSAESAQAWLESEWRNIIKAAEYAAKHEWKWHCAELAHILSEFLDIRGSWDEAIVVHSHALQACRDLADLPGIARASLDLSLASQRKGRHKSALQHASEALSVYEAIRDQRGRALAFDRMGMIQFFSGRFRQALAYDQEAKTLYAEAEDQAGEAEAIFHAGASCLNLGRLEESMGYFRNALILFKRTGNERGRAKAINSIAEIKLHQGYHREAIDNYQEALVIYRELGSRQEQATVKQNIGSVYLYKGNLEDALNEFRSALTIFRDSRDLPRQACALCDIGDAYLSMERYSESLIHYQNAAAIAEQVGDHYVKAIALRGIANAYRGSDCRDRAMTYYNDALKLAYEIEDPYQQAKILDGIAETMFRAGELSTARIYLRQAHDLYQRTGSVEAQTAEIRLQILSASYPDA